MWLSIHPHPFHPSTHLYIHHPSNWIDDGCINVAINPSIQLQHSFHSIHIHHPPIPSIIFIGIVRSACLKLVGYVRTRWNSVYSMLKRFLTLKYVVQLFLGEEQIAVGGATNVFHKLSDANFQFMTRVVKLLAPFFELTESFSANKISIADVIPRIIQLKTFLERCRAQEVGRVLGWSASAPLGVQTIRITMYFTPQPVPSNKYTHPSYCPVCWRSPISSPPSWSPALHTTIFYSIIYSLFLLLLLSFAFCNLFFCHSLFSLHSARPSHSHSDSLSLTTLSLTYYSGRHTEG